MILLNVTTALWAVLVPLVDEVPAPEDVKPGWLGFGVFLLLAAAVVFLALSFRKQLRKVDFEEGGDQRQGAADPDAGAPDAGAPGSNGDGNTPDSRSS